jgi:hypothetical protein
MKQLVGGGKKQSLDTINLKNFCLSKHAPSEADRVPKRKAYSRWHEKGILKKAKLRTEK